MNQHTIELIFERLAQEGPEPTTELYYTNPYTLLVAVILSAQATDAGVNKATPKLFEMVDTPEAMLTLGVDNLKKMIKTIGLYPTKAKHIIQMSKQLIEMHGGQVPRTREALESLAGVGRKTANVILNTAFGELTIAVDTHVFRVSNRIGLVKASNVLACEKQLMEAIPEAILVDAHHHLILHGRYVCKARKPDCKHCAISDLCEQNI